MSLAQLNYCQGMTRSDRTRRRRLDPETRRAAIIEAAGQQFAASPYDTVSVAEIAAEAGASEALVYRYFNTKAELYVEVLREVLDEVAARHRAAAASLPPDAESRDRVRAQLDTYLDTLATRDEDWRAALLLAVGEPPEAAAVRAESEAELVAELRTLVAAATGDDYVLHGYLGFLGAICSRWTERGCPSRERASLVTAALGALFGGLAGERIAEPVRRSKFGNRF